TGSPMYGYGYSAYNNPYAGGMTAGNVAGFPGAATQPAPLPYNYTQPLNTAPPPQLPVPNVAQPGPSDFDQAPDALRAGDYPTALQGVQKALAKTPNDATMHEFLALVLFAQGKYDQAAAPLYAVLSVGPGWDWTTLISNYSDANTYTEQLRALEGYTKANPGSAPAQFVLAYHYIAQGQGEAAVKPLKALVALQPKDALAAQLLNMVQPASAS